MKTIYPEGYYNISEYQMSVASVEELEKWANDPTCIDTKAAAHAIDNRLLEKQILKADEQKRQGEEERRMAKKRQGLEYNPFDVRTEISADAVHIASRIVTHLWIIFVLLPFVLGLLYVLITAR